MSAGVTWLFVPGDRTDRFEKARASGADEVICDLEDAVVDERKGHARGEVTAWLSQQGAAWVRINAVDTPWFDDDVTRLAGLPGLRGIVVPKSEDPGALQRVSQAVGASVGLIALVETARGVHLAHEIASCGAVDRIAFGSIDFANDVSADLSDDSLQFARSTLVIASRVAGKPAPIDGVTTAFGDAAAVQVAASRARRTGFGGKLCIHPAQIAPVAAAFRPSEEEIRWAREIVGNTDEFAAGPRATNGAMVDKPVLERARRILQQSQDGDG